MERLRERINMLTPYESGYDRWVTVYETQEGGAIVCMDFENNLESLAKADEKMKEEGIIAEMDINPSETAFIFVDQNNNEVPFDIVMKAMFD